MARANAALTEKPRRLRPSNRRRCAVCHQRRGAGSRLTARRVGLVFVVHPAEAGHAECSAWRSRPRGFAALAHVGAERAMNPATCWRASLHFELGGRRGFDCRGGGHQAIPSPALRCSRHAGLARSERTADGDRRGALHGCLRRRATAHELPGAGRSVEQLALRSLPHEMSAASPDQTCACTATRNCFTALRLPTLQPWCGLERPGRRAGLEPPLWTESPRVCSCRSARIDRILTATLRAGTDPTRQPPWLNVSRGPLDQGHGCHPTQSLAVAHKLEDRPTRRAADALLTPRA